MTALLYLLVVVCALLPTRYVAPSLPALWILQNTILGEPGVLFNAGSAHLSLVDFLLVALLLKMVVTVVSTRQFPVDKLLYGAIAIYFGVNFLATVAAGAKFGNAQLIPCMTSLARFVAEIVIVPIMAQAVTTIPQAKRCIGIVIATLAVLAAIQFINFFGASHGFVIGEVQGTEREEARYFGPLGDSVGVVLLLGFVVSLCFANVAGIVAFLGGIVLTAGLGAIFSAGRRHGVVPDIWPRDCGGSRVRSTNALASADGCVRRNRHRSGLRQAVRADTSRSREQGQCRAAPTSESRRQRTQSR